MAMYDVAIIGGGPAGLVAARYCHQAYLRTAIITPELGGKVNYPFALRKMDFEHAVWGANLVHDFEEVIAAAGAATHLRYSVKQISRAGAIFEIKLDNGEVVSSRSIIVTTGAAPQRLFVSGEKEYWGRGVSFSAISHAPFFNKRDVAVVGGGRRALLAVLELAPLANKIYLIAAHPQSMATLPEAERVQSQHNVILFTNWEVQEIVGDDFVTSINLVGTNGETRSLPVEGVFIQFALLPNNELVRDLVALDQEGHIIVNQRCETNVPGIFAAGDVTNIHVEQVLVAVGEGAKAALSAWEYLATNTS
jgi:thioredoxin reductase